MSSVKTFLFLDDWMLDSYRDIVRRFPRPSPVAMEPVTEMENYATVIRDPERSRYRAWYTRFFPVEGKTVAAKCLSESDDGLRWERVKLREPVDRLGHLQENLVFSGLSGESGAGILYDPRDPDRKRRYKLANADRLAVGIDDREKHPEGHLGYRSVGLLAYSEDGVRWRIDRERPFYTVPGGTDTLLVPLYNQVTGRYQVSVRPSVLDRRIAIVESPDLVTWSKPLTVLTPDPLDEPCLQFYGMPWFSYEDLFIGLLWDHHTSQDELMGGCKWSGAIDCELAYSYNGVHWNRMDRRPFIGRAEQGAYGCGSIYPHSLVRTDGERLRIYSAGLLVDHSLEKAPAGYESVGAMIAHELRMDGFACLEPRAGWGTVTMRSVKPRSGTIELNFRAPVGRVLAQVSEPSGSLQQPAQSRKPIDGYRFEDCVPLSGDHLAARLRWKDKADASELVGRHVQLELKLFQAELYAVRWDVQPWYGDLPIERI